MQRFTTSQIRGILENTRLAKGEKELKGGESKPRRPVLEVNVNRLPYVSRFLSAQSEIIDQSGYEADP